MKEKTLQVLLVEDNAGDAGLLRRMFSNEKPGSFELTHLVRMSEAEAHLAKGGVDILLLDMGLPDGHGLDTVRRAHTVAPGVPMIVLTGLDDEVLAAEAMKEGAQDYLIKGQIENRALPRALRHAIERFRMQAETDLIRTQQMQFKDDFLSHVSHELRSPLTSIYSFGTIIADGLAGETSQQQNDYLQIILRNVRQLQSMIEDLLEVTQIQAGKLSLELQCATVSEAIDYAVDTLQGAARAKEIIFSFNASALLPLVYADPTRLRQILTILFDNAIKFTPIGGAVNVQAMVFDKSPGFLLVEVSDTGCGISREMTERIFEHLYQVTDAGQAGRKGLGLGLHIAKELVTRQGGEIWVTSELRNGSHFFFTVPIFSLAGLIGPMLAHVKKPGEAITVFAVEVHSRDGSPGVPKEISTVARILLQQSLRRNLDVLLPNIAPASEILFVVGYTQEVDAEIFSKRIQGRFQSNEQFQSANFTIAVSHSFLTPRTRGIQESMETFGKRVAAGIQDRISTMCLLRSA